jgi:4-hydroxybenzoate polyprenyltransferase
MSQPTPPRHTIVPLPPESTTNCKTVFFPTRPDSERDSMTLSTIISHCSPRSPLKWLSLSSRPTRVSWTTLSANTSTTTTKTTTPALEFRFRRPLPLPSWASYCQIRYLSTRTTDPNVKNNKHEKLKQSQSLDPPILTWIDDYLPTKIQPYARLARIDKPIGTWLLLWPCAWSTALAAAPAAGGPYDYLPDPALLGLFAAGAFIMRGAGCTINDLWDQDIDRQVSRTASRPLAAGDLTTRQAVGFLALQLSAGLGILLSLPHLHYCFLWGASSLPLVIAYPLMKRYTDYPQLVLGLTFNWGAWMGWAATYGTMDYTIIAPLYLSGVTWTLVYDTIYANQDKVDDAKLGLKSTALTFGSDPDQHKKILHGLAALTYLQWLAVGCNCPHDMLSLAPYGLGVSVAYGHLLWQIQTAQLDDPQNLAQRFRSNTHVGAIVFASIIAGKLFL